MYPIIGDVVVFYPKAPAEPGAEAIRQPAIVHDSRRLLDADGYTVDLTAFNKGGSSFYADVPLEPDPIVYPCCSSRLLSDQERGVRVRRDREVNEPTPLESEKSPDAPAQAE